MDRAAHPAERILREQSVACFARQTFGLRGTLGLHRAAFGLDLLRAPLNVALAPVFLLVRLGALAAARLGLSGAAEWLGRRRILMPSAVARRVADRVCGLIAELEIPAPPAAIARAVDDYVAVRSAVAEITTTILVVIFGVVIVGAATPGVISLSGPVSELVGHASAVSDFPLGPRLGALYYRVFPLELPLWFVLATGLVLTTVASLVTTFAGILADPLQVALGVHQRRLRRLLDRLEDPAATAGLAKEHVAARAADLSDLFLSLIRALRS